MRRHSRDDPREDVGDDVGVGVVECGLYKGGIPRHRQRHRHHENVTRKTVPWNLSYVFNGVGQKTDVK